MERVQSASSGEARLSRYEAWTMVGPISRSGAALRYAARSAALGGLGDHWFWFCEKICAASQPISSARPSASGSEPATET